MHGGGLGVGLLCATSVQFQFSKMKKKKREGDANHILSFSVTHASVSSWPSIRRSRFETISVRTRMSRDREREICVGYIIHAYQNMICTRLTKSKVMVLRPRSCLSVLGRWTPSKGFVRLPLRIFEGMSLLNKNARSFSFLLTLIASLLAETFLLFLLRRRLPFLLLFFFQSV